MTAEERQPQVKQVAAAGVQRAQQPPGMLPVMEGERQGERVLEEVDHGGEAPPVRQAVGVERDQDVGCHAEEADAGPPADVTPGVGRARRGQGVDHPAEQPRLQQEDHGQRDVGGGQCRGEPALRRQQGEDAQVDLQQRHVISGAVCARGRDFERADARMPGAVIPHGR